MVTNMKLIILNKRKHKDIEIDVDESIGTLKKMLRLKIPLEYVVLKYNEKELDDSKSVRDSGLSDSCNKISIYLKIWYNYYNCNDSDKMLLVKYKDRMKDLKKECAHQLKINRKTKCTDIFNSVRKNLKDKDVLFVIHTENGFLNKIEKGHKKIKDHTKDIPQIKEEPEREDTQPNKEKTDKDTNKAKVNDPVKVKPPNKVGPATIGTQPNTAQMDRNTPSHKTNIKDATKGIPEPQKRGRQHNEARTDRDTPTKETHIKYTTKGVPQIKVEPLEKDRQLNEARTDRDTPTEEKRDSRSKISLSIQNNLDKQSINQQFVVDVDLDTSVQTLRRMLSDNVQRNLCNVDIFHKEKLLGEGRLGDLGVRHKDTLTLKKKILPKNLGQQFVVKVENDGTKCEQPYMIGDLETVGALKSVLREQYNVKVDAIKLYLKKRELRDDQIIRLLDIDSGSRITLMIKDNIEDDKEGRINIKTENRITDDRRCMEVSVDRKDTVESLTHRLSKTFDLPSDEFVLSFRGEIMKKDNLIDTYGIEEGDEVVLSHSLLVRIFVAGDSGSAKVSRYPFDAEDRVLDLKAMISRRVNIESRFIALTYDGETLEDEMTLGEAAVENESYVLMITTLAGGANL